MFGINIDLFPVILMVILAFICGYSGGHRFGREETYAAFNKAIEETKKSLIEVNENTKHNAEEKAKTLMDILQEIAKIGDNKEDPHE